MIHIYYNSYKRIIWKFTKHRNNFEMGVRIRTGQQDKFFRTGIRTIKNISLLDKLSVLLAPFYLIISFYEIIFDLNLSKETKIYLIVMSDLCFFNLVHVGVSFSLLKTSSTFHNIYTYLRKTKPQFLTALLHIKNIDLRETNKFQDKSSGFQIMKLFMPSP